MVARRCITCHELIVGDHVPDGMLMRHPACARARDGHQATTRLCIDVRQVGTGSAARVVVRVTSRTWGEAAAYEIWVPTPFGWAAHADDIDAAIARAIAD